MKDILLSLLYGIMIVFVGFIFGLSAKWIVLLELCLAFVLWVIKTM